MYNLTLSMIVKNEAPNIERCLESVAPFINYYVICDTGSTDNTKEVIKNFFDKKGIPGEILDHEWKHFGHNRSLALKACYGKTKWALMIDADDFISGKLPVEKFDDSVDGYVVKIKRGPYEWYRGQIFNLGKKLWWYEEPLHEYAICEQPMKVEKLEGDYGWEVRTEGCRSRESGGDDREKYRRDYVFLKKYLEEHPDNVRTQFYLAQSAFDAHMFDVAEQEYEKRAGMGGWVEEVFYSWMRVGIARELQNKPLEHVIDAFMKAYDALPTRAEPFWQMSCIYRKHNRPRSAFVMAMHGLQIPLPQDNILFVDTGVYTWGILDEVATTAAHAGKYHLGLEATAKLLSEPYLPEDQRERVSNNRKLYLEAVTKFNMQVAEQQQKVLEKQQEAMKKIEDNSKKTTLGIDLSKTPVTL
jgi:glycosyltransferase involved in cell wall biosynthesis